MTTTENSRNEQDPTLDTLLAAQIGVHSRHWVNDPETQVPLSEALASIHNGTYSSLVDAARVDIQRHGYPSKAYDTAKGRLPVFTFSGVCHRELGSSHVIEPSGALVLDYDKLPSAAVASAFRDAAGEVPHTVAAFLSPSRRGFKIVVALYGAPPSNDEAAFKRSFAAAVSAYESALGVKVDSSGSDPTHLCYVSHDPDMVWGQGVPLPWTNFEPPNEGRASAGSKGTKNRRHGRPRQMTVDTGVLEDALRHIPCPRTTGDGDAFDAWLDLVIRQKSVGRTIEQAARWCVGGNARSCTSAVEDLEQRWNDLPSDDPGLAYDRILADARKAGWSSPNGSRASDSRQDPPDLIQPDIPPQAPYPIPQVMSRHHRGIHETSGASATAAVAFQMGSMSLLASQEYDVAWPPGASTPTPISLFLLHLAESGSRKNTAFEKAFAGHAEADVCIESHWKAAKAEWERWQSMTKEQRRTSGEEAPEETTKYSPKALRRDVTPQALAQRFDGGRRTQGYVNAEAGSILSSGAWSMARDQRAKTLSDYSEVFSSGCMELDRVRDDLEVTVRDVRLTIAWAIQPNLGRPFLSSADAANGFAARVLVSADDVLPPYRGTQYQWPSGESAQTAADEWTEIIIRVRQRQDSPFKKKRTGRRKVILIDPSAETLIVQCGQAAHEEAQSDKALTPHEKSFLVRVGEHVARVAGVLAAYRSYQEQEESTPTVSVEDAEAAAAVVRWHYQELVRQASVAGATQDSDAAKWVAANVSRCMNEDKYLSKVEGCYRIRHWLGSNAAGAARHLRSDPQARERVIELLETHGHIEEVARGAYLVNPRIGEEGGDG